MSPKVPIPDMKVGELRDFLPALQYAISAVRRREKAMTSRFEVVGARTARDARQELEELVETLEAVEE